MRNEPFALKRVHCRGYTEVPTTPENLWRNKILALLSPWHLRVTLEVDLIFAGGEQRIHICTFLFSLWAAG